MPEVDEDDFIFGDEPLGLEERANHSGTTLKSTIAAAVSRIAGSAGGSDNPADHGKTSCCRGIGVHIQAYFVTIATILGTGILGLPIKLSHAGFGPFIITFLVNWVVQVILIYYMLEVLQKASAAQRGNAGHNNDGFEHVALDNMESNVASVVDANGSDDGEHSHKKRGWRPSAGSRSSLTNMLDDEEETELFDFETGVVRSHHDVAVLSDATGVRRVDGPVGGSADGDDEDDTEHVRGGDEGSVDGAEGASSEDPNLHSLGEMFLKQRYLRAFFHFVVLLQFLSLLVSYGLAGSEAYGQVLHVNYAYVIPFFISLCTLAIVFGSSMIQLVISLLTFTKGSLLVLTVAVTAYVGLRVHNVVSDHYAAIGDPILLGSVALGGTPNVMPLLYARVMKTAPELQRFRRFVVAGTFTCLLLNILWCYSVLAVVPQCDGGDDGVHNCTISLYRSHEEGEIATVPLIEIIRRDHPSVSWIAQFVAVFMMLSITVSFLTMGSALRHTLDGWVDYLLSSSRGVCARAMGRCHSSLGLKALLYMASFGVVLLIAQLNPKGFVDVLEKGTSIALNIETGVFIVVMLHLSRLPPFGALDVPLPLNRVLVALMYPVLAYTVFTVGFGVFKTIYDAAVHQR